MRYIYDTFCTKKTSINNKNRLKTQERSCFIWPFYKIHPSKLHILFLAAVRPKIEMFSSHCQQKSSASTFTPDYSVCAAVSTQSWVSHSSHKIIYNRKEPSCSIAQLHQCRGFMMTSLNIYICGENGFIEKSYTWKRVND